mmetsp:Transcript_20683/g.30451  ORF Transcript_20683/g.30451 Transcript_20683/m.30451 type:complete len:393 (+) Transcript_20683:72-1250(+)|eukprot:CAMPEP_0195529650 /NCGR_PEP_ID=MMETSP0794_2-20130614/32271_1 /TAXON_ID=515487 /ORGANISM="Stephanopyxis turris, Strain CCMP 815" /LENGTH=392 /DNA_ID=CAMNT_0040660997 /DNA_START=54 /DNA_END=1232 /DNA_ORIENTATION=+
MTSSRSTKCTRSTLNIATVLVATFMNQSFSSMAFTNTNPTFLSRGYKEHTFQEGISSSTATTTELCSLFSSSSLPDPSSSDEDLYFGLENIHQSQESVYSESSARQERKKREAHTKERFVYGNDLLDLRNRLKELKDDLLRAERDGDNKLAEVLRASIHKSQKKDAEYMLGYLLELSEMAHTMGRVEEAKKHEQEAEEVKKCLPQFNLEGLWVGKYGSNGYEMINVTYVGDTLIAHKVTGDKNVPKGKITFTADISPCYHAGRLTALSPIELTAAASKQWGTKELVRYPGMGQVAAEGFVNNKFLDGQLIMVGEEYFSFAWIPIGHQIFFGRPSAELTLKMLRQSELHDEIESAEENSLATMREIAMRCFETDLITMDDGFEYDSDDENNFQ